MANPYESAAQILQGLGAPVKALVSDSRQLQPGVVFAAYPGEASDGRAYIAQAIARGAGGVLWETDQYAWDPVLDVPNVGVPGLKARIGEIASHVYGEPSKKVQMIGVTGTNGKTSVAHWTAQALTQLGKKTAIVGTAGNGFPHALTPAVNTTPDAIELQQRLAHYLQQGAAACAMEVSSHGLAQSRVNGTHFDIAVFTNLSRDHLDYHGTMENYAAVKARLFHWPGLEWAVLNNDDAYGRQLEGMTRSARVASYGFERGAVVARRLNLLQSGMQMELHTEWGNASLEAPLLGRFNASNLLAVLTTLLVSGVALDEACAALADIEPPPGRMQTLGGGKHPLVIIDYAHTPDALEKVLATLREIDDN
ncbi:MAG: Mur ligase family protein, partial [Thiobacillus sp.]